MTARVLVVDDVLANVKLLEAKLTSEYYDVIIARDGFEAITQAKAHKLDIILLDVMMSGMDGIEVLRHVRADPSFADLPVVMFSALSDPSFQQHARSKGANDYWVKAALDINTLKQRVDDLLPPGAGGEVVA